jgi:hypothetical protein
VGRRSRTKRERKAQSAARLTTFFNEAREDFRGDLRDSITVTAKYPGNVRLNSMAIEYASPPDEPAETWNAFFPWRTQRSLSAAIYADVVRQLRAAMPTLSEQAPPAARWDNFATSLDLIRRASATAVNAGTLPNRFTIPFDRLGGYINPAAAWMLKNSIDTITPTPLTHPREFMWRRMTEIIAESPSPAIWLSVALVMREELKASEEPEKWLPLRPFHDAKPVITAPNTLRAFVRRRVEALPEEAMVHLDRLLEVA